MMCVLGEGEPPVSRNQWIRFSFSRLVGRLALSVNKFKKNGGLNPRFRFGMNGAY